MKSKKTITVLVLFIAVFSLLAAAYGIFSRGGPGQHLFTSVHGQVVTIYGIGLYQNDSLATATQGISMDIITLVLGIPLLLISLYLFRKGLVRGRILLSGSLAYFLYTYTSYSFLSMYNQLFLIYVMLMSASLFAFILSMMSFEIKKVSSYFSEKLPIKFIGGLILIISIGLGLMWLSLILKSLLSGTVPTSLEHYSTLVIQGMDLGFVVPTGIISGILIIKKRAFGYLLAPVITIIALTMLSALTAMIIGQMLADIKMNIIMMIFVPIFNLIVIYSVYLIMKNVIEPKAE